MKHHFRVDTYWGEDGRLLQWPIPGDSVLSWLTSDEPRLKGFLVKFKNHANQIINSEREEVVKERAFDQFRFEDTLDSTKAKHTRADERR